MNKGRMFRGMRFVFALGATGLLAGCVNLVFSSDGKSIAFPWGDEKFGSVAVVNVDGSGFRFLAGTRDKNPLAWSPDGKRLLVGPSARDGDLVLVNLEAGRSRKLISNATNHAVWTDDPNRIVTVQNGEAGLPDAMVWLDLGTGAETLRVSLTSSKPSESHSLHWLASTDSVAFLGNDGNVYAVIRGEATRITTTGDVVGFGSGERGNKLIWARRSRNPRYILLSLYQYDVNLRSVRKLSFPDRIASINPSPRQGPTELEFVILSPDLSEMAILSRDNSKQPAELVLYRVGIDGRGAKLLRRYADEHKDAPFGLTWSPDSQNLAVMDFSETSVKLKIYAPRAIRTLRAMTIPKKGH